MDLRDWLEDIDLEDYHEGFLSLGVKKVKYLKDVTQTHLEKMGLKELEVNRFMNKLSQEQTPASVEKQNVNRVEVKMPTSTFGRSTISHSEKDLIRIYPDMYYEGDPTGKKLNWKQRQSNTFALKMCASAAWKFDKKSSLYKWARKERDSRLNVLLTFASVEDLKNDSEYFQEQSILCRQSKLAHKYADIRSIIAGLKPKNKLSKERVMLYSTEVKGLVDWAENGMKEIEEKLLCVKKKENGYKEELEYWQKRKLLTL